VWRQVERLRRGQDLLASRTTQNFVLLIEGEEYPELLDHTMVWTHYGLPKVNLNKLPQVTNINLH